jgi:DNA-directed RNA polymerase subunit RPC12/RpoP
MSQARPEKYRHQVCPHCNSKKVKIVAMVDMGGKWYLDVRSVESTGYLCGNCKRYHPELEIKYAYDRGEMRRDVKNLLRFLAGETK